MSHIGFELTHAQTSTQLSQPHTHAKSERASKQGSAARATAPAPSGPHVHVSPLSLNLAVSAATASGLAFRNAACTLLARAAASLAAVGDPGGEAGTAGMRDVWICARAIAGKTLRRCFCWLCNV